MNGKSNLLDHIETEQLIKSRVPNQEIWYFLLGYYPKHNQRVSNPLRVDKQPSAVFLYYPTLDELILHDYSMGKSWTSISAVMQAYNVKKPEALSIIQKGVTREINLMNHEYVVHVPQRSWIFSINKGYWTKDRIQYWQQYGVEKEIMKEMHIHYATSVWGRHKDQCDTRLLTGNCFAYRFDTRYKIYNPFGDPKWLSNTNASDIFGLDSVKDHQRLIITSSGKDTATLRSIAFRHQYNYDVIAPQSEGQLIPQINDLKNKYEKIILWYDNDDAGQSFSLKHATEYDCEFVIQPSIYKDPSDWYLAEGEIPLINFIESWI